MFSKHFRLKKPCGNCPFLKGDEAVALQEGRLEGIINDLIQDDHSTFQCHKTVHHKNGGEWDDNDDYIASGNEAMCFGAIVFLHKKRMPTVGMRVALVTGDLTLQEIEEQSHLIIDDIKEAKII